MVAQLVQQLFVRANRDRRRDNPAPRGAVKPLRRVGCQTRQ